MSYENFDNILREYSEGNISWRELNEAGLDYRDILAGLGRLGLRQPIVRKNGPNSAALQRGSAVIRQLLKRRHQETGSIS